MKKVQNIILVLLIISNIVLGIEVYRLKSIKPPSENNNQEITTKVSEFDTDVTRVVEEVDSTVVSIANYVGEVIIGNGSGVVYKAKDDSAFIVTNHHVVENGNHVRVKFSSGETLVATVLGSNGPADLAVLEVRGIKEGKAIKIGNSDKVKVGEFVVAMGTPIDKAFYNSATFGVVSGKGRSVSTDLFNKNKTVWDMDNLIQIDATINPGNSGGALINMAGELIGINTLKLKESIAEGMGFAIPINETMYIVEQLETKGDVQYPVVGIRAVAISDLNDTQKEEYNIKDNQEGILVIDITPQSPAQKANIKKGDIIIEFENTKVKDFTEFRRVLSTKSPKDKVTIKILRGTDTLDVEVTLG